MNRKFWLNCMQQVLNYPEDLCVQSKGDLLDCGRSARAHHQQRVQPAPVLDSLPQNLFFRSEDMSNLYFQRCIIQWFLES